MQQRTIEIRIVPDIDIMYLKIQRKLIFIINREEKERNIYCDISGKVINILKYYLHKFPIPTPMTILIIFFVVWKSHSCMENVSKIYPLIKNIMDLKMINRLNTFCVSKFLIALNAKQATLNFCFIISIWFFHIIVYQTLIINI